MNTNTTNTNVKVTPKNIVNEARDIPWSIDMKPFRVAPHIYYVGNRWVGSFLLETSEGLAFIDTTVMETLYLLLESIRTRLSAGHTPGTTSFFISVKDEAGNPLTWGMHGGVGINTMNTDYLNKVHLPLSLQDTFLKGCGDMKSIHVDICTPSHPSHSDMMERVPADRIDYTPL